MRAEDLKKFELARGREEHTKSAHIYTHQSSLSWGLFVVESERAFVVSVLGREQLYENFFRQESSSITFRVEMLLHWLLDHRVLIPEPAEVRNYLTRYFGLTSILRSTCQLALDRFGLQSQLSLEIYGDPETEDEYLTLYIRQTRYSEDILNAIEALRSAYEVDLADSSGWFLITTDFRPPL